jgi:hypothetical protein
MNIPRPGPDEALLLDATTGAWCIVPRSAITGEPIASIVVPEHRVDEGLARVLALIDENND